MYIYLLKYTILCYVFNHVDKKNIDKFCCSYCDITNDRLKNNIKLPRTKVYENKTNDDQLNIILLRLINYIYYY